jgi:hypothetical protein
MESGNNPFLPDGRQWAWNSSSLNPAKTCARKYYYEVICGYVTKDENVHLTFGGIYASALEQYHSMKASCGDHQAATIFAVSYALTASYGKLSAAECADLAQQDTKPVKISSAQSYGISMNTKTTPAKRLSSLTESQLSSLLSNLSMPTKYGLSDISIGWYDTEAIITFKIKKPQGLLSALGISKDTTRTIKCHFILLLEQSCSTLPSKE